MLPFRLLLASALTAMVAANSLGLNVPLCDTDDSAIWRSKSAGGSYMYWCDPPTWDADFSVRTADGPNSDDDPKVYRPGGLVYIHVRALKQGLKYRGLLLYAQDEKLKKVGTWELPEEDEISFHTPPGSCEDQETEERRAVMHSGADPKNYHNMFAFRAPTGTNTGPITFKVLLKTGEANVGAFHWPQSNTGKALTLTRTSNGPLNNWRLSKTGQTCKERCAQDNNLVCDEGLLGTVESESTFQHKVGKEHACRLPILAACTEAGPFQWKSHDFCFYQRSDCTKQVKCNTRNGQRFCPCKTGTLLTEEPLKSAGTDSWTESAGTDSWTELAHMEASASAESDATMSTSSKCGKFFTEPTCRAAGCFFSEQAGMVICSKKQEDL